MFLKNKTLKVWIALIIVLIIAVLSWVYLFMPITISREPYSVSYDEAVRCARDAASQLSDNDYVYLDEILNVYFQNKPSEEVYEKYGQPHNRDGNGVLFGKIYDKGFENIESMNFHGEEIGLSFAYGNLYPYDYEDKEYDKWHIEYGVCFFFDEYAEDIPVSEGGTNYSSSSMEITFSEKLYGNLYSYAAVKSP